MSTVIAFPLPEFDAPQLETAYQLETSRPTTPFAVESLLTLAFDARRRVSQRLEIASHLAASDCCHGLLEQLLPRLESNSARDRQVAALALGSPGNLRAIFHLIALLDDPAISVRRAAVRGLAGIGDPRALSFLTGVLDRDDRLVTTALSAIRRFPLELTRDTFERFLSSPDPEIAVLALGAFVFAAPETAAPIARPFLRHPDPRLRCLAVSLVAASGDHTYLEPLFPLIGDPDRRVREISRDAIASLRA